MLSKTCVASLIDRLTSPMKLPSTQQYTPWLPDPDPRQKSMTPEQATEVAARLIGIKPPTEEEARATERGLFAMLRRVKAWLMALDTFRCCSRPQLHNPQ